MVWWILAAIALVLLKIANVYIDHAKKVAATKAYRSAENLLTPAEQRFWLTLRQSLPPSVMACPKVRLIDVLTPSDGDHSAKQRVLRKHLDFVLMDSTNTRILGAIELDDSSHSRKDRRERDEFVDAALYHAGIPILRVTVARNYDGEVIAGQINQMLGKKKLSASA